MTFEGTAEPTALDDTLVTLAATVHRLVKQLADGALDPFDQVRLIGLMQDFEQLRNLMSVIDHYTMAAAQRLDLPTSLDFIGSTAFVTTLNGEVWKITNVSKFKH